MPTPGPLNAPIYKGAKYEHTLTFYVKGTATPVNLTGLGPFVCTVSHPKRDTILATFTVTETNLAAGQITVTGLPAQTDELDEGTVRLGIRDVQGNPYVANSVPVLFFSPDPP